ncbi:MAG: response regulator [Elusimicrobiota bacterium]
MPKVLLADDDAEILELLTYSFQMENYEVVTAIDGEEAVKKATAELPDLIVLDVMMPRKTGFEALEQIRSYPATMLTPVIMLTSMSQLKDRLTGIKLGADEYLPKPIEPYELIARAERLLERTKAALAMSPLTGLPSNANAEAEIKKRLDEAHEFALVYLDLKRFGSYNKVYGYEMGDNIIRLLGIITRSAVKEIGSPTDMVAHLGSDDFMIITTTPNLQPLCETIAQNFQSLSGTSYSKEDQQRGYFILRTDAGTQEQMPLITLAIGATLIPAGTKHFVEAIDKVKKCWQEAKQTVQDHVVVK